MVGVGVFPLGESEGVITGAAEATMGSSGSGRGSLWVGIWEWKKGRICKQEDMRSAGASGCEMTCGISVINVCVCVSEGRGGFVLGGERRRHCRGRGGNDGNLG